ncbi:hypothetical protein ACQPV1_18455 [Clostridium neonatale]|uniref:hypothetical protein n=1 Tax=Clostridium neonatale TaxID=137838 RepID=UPI003D34A129
MENNTQNNFQNSNAAYLSSPFNFKNELKKFNWLYFIFGIAGFFIDSDTHILGMIVGILTAFFIISAIIAQFKVGSLRTMTFSLPDSANLTYKDLADMITVPLSKINMTVELLSDTLRIAYKGMEYDITILPEQCAFKIWPQKNFVRRLASKLYTGLYKKSIYAVPIIAYTIQSTFKKSLSEDTIQNDTDEKIFSAAKNMDLYLKNNMIYVIGGISLAFIILIVIGIFSGSTGDSHYIDMVKDGNLTGYNSQSVGKAFDDFFSDEKWEYFESENGQDIVEFNGDCFKDNNLCHVCVQFTVNENDNSFEVQYYSLDNEPQNLMTWAYMLDKIYENE